MKCSVPGPRARIFGFVAVCLTSGIVVAMGSDFKQSSCVTSQEGKYVSITLSDGVREKVVNFVSDGITYWSQPPGGSSAGDYEDVSQIVYEGEDNSSGMLSIEFTDASRKPKLIGVIDSECWHDVMRLMKSNAGASHIQLEERARQFK